MLRHSHYHIFCIYDPTKKGMNEYLEKNIDISSNMYDYHEQSLPMSRIPVDETFLVQPNKFLYHSLWSFVIHCETLLRGWGGQGREASQHW